MTEEGGAMGAEASGKRISFGAPRRCSRPSVRWSSGLSDRLGAIEIEDASLNALVILTTFGDEGTLAVLREDLERWERPFRDHCG